MKKIKDINYYRMKHRKYIKIFDFVNDKDFWFHDLYLFIPFVLCALIFDLEKNFSLQFTYFGGVLSTLFFMFLFWNLGALVTLILSYCLKNYYFKKVRFLFDLEFKEVHPNMYARNKDK